jgi:hypothetical protein
MSATRSALGGSVNGGGAQHSVIAEIYETHSPHANIEGTVARCGDGGRPRSKSSTRFWGPGRVDPAPEFFYPQCPAEAAPEITPSPPLGRELLKLEQTALASAIAAVELLAVGVRDRPT